MLFNSPVFILIFLPVALIGFYALLKWHNGNGAALFLVAASLFFYGWWEPVYVLLISGSVVFNYSIGWALINARRDSRQPSKRVLILGIVGNLGLLGVFKYADFAISSFGALSQTEFTTVNIVLPLAISFFTFQQIAYLVDAHAGKVTETRFVTYCLFVTFFPQLIAGPIVHHAEMMPQFLRHDRLRRLWPNLAVGTTIFILGLLKKIALGDTAALWSDGVFGAAALGDAPSLIEAWIGTLAFTLQIYFDFSGYSDMAIGLARMFGIRLPLNFDSPYKATSIIDFWHRWHMTLSRFLRDYLYVPLGGRTLGWLVQYRNIMIVMLLGGLWHGAAWTFVIWGGLHGVYLVINHAWRRWRGNKPVSIFGVWAYRSVMLLAVSFAWVFFRAESFDSSLIMFNGLLGFNGVHLPSHYASVLGNLAPILQNMGVEFTSLTNYGGGWQIVTLFVMLGMVLFLPSTQEFMRYFRPALEFHLPRTKSQLGGLAKLIPPWRPSVITGIFASIVAISLVLQLLQGDSGEFIYFQF